MLFGYIRTQELLQALETQVGINPNGETVMLVDGDFENEKLVLAARNVKWISTYPQRGANVYSIVKHHKLIMTPAGLEAITARLLQLPSH